MSAKYHIKDLLRNGEFVWAPCVYDCVSAYCAELAGYNACLLYTSSPSFGMLDTMLNTMDGFYMAQNTTTFMVQFMIPPSGVEGSGWEDELVRQAAYYAIDSEAIIDSVTYGMATYTNQYAGPGTSYYNDDLAGYEYNVEKAKELMAQSSYPDGFTTKLYASNENTALYTAIGVALQSYLAEIGIKVEIELLEPAVWVETFMNAKDGDVYKRQVRHFTITRK